MEHKMYYFIYCISNCINYDKQNTEQKKSLKKSQMLRYVMSSPIKHMGGWNILWDDS